MIGKIANNVGAYWLDVNFASGLILSFVILEVDLVSSHVILNVAANRNKN